MENLKNELESIKNSLDESLQSKMADYTAQVKDMGAANDATRADVKAMATDLEQINNEILDIKQRTVATNGLPATAQSIGAQFVNSESFKAHAANVSAKATQTFTNNTITTTSDGFQTRSEQGVILPQRAKLTILDVIDKASVSGSVVPYRKVSSAASVAGMQTEGSAKTEANITFAEVTETVQTVAHWVEVSKQMLQDAPYVESVINGELAYGVRAKTASQIINGDGTGSNFNGLLKTGNNTPVVVTSLSTISDAAARLMTEIDLQGRVASYFLMNPLDLFDVQTAKGSDGHYTTKGFDMVNGMATLWGLPSISSSDVPQGTLVCIGERAAIYFESSDVTITSSDSHGSNFTSNVVTILAESRGCVTVPYANAVVTCDLSTLTP